MNKPYTKLEKHVAKWLKETGKDYSDGAQGAYNDLMQGGCVSGMVGHLIYYHDTIRFYRTYRNDIEALLSDTCSNIGESPSSLFNRAGWDNDDPLARDTNNQNILAWFGFEEAARQLMEF